MTMNEEFSELIRKHANEETMQLLRQILEELNDAQNAQEAKLYESLPVTPAEVSSIVAKAGGGCALMTSFAVDAARHYQADKLLYRYTPTTGALLMATFLVEAGRILGIKQERAKQLDNTSAAQDPHKILDFKRE